MAAMRVSRRQVLKGAGAALGVVGTLGPRAAFAGQRVRWDIVSVDLAAGTVSEGGHASAQANDKSKITITGSGTFNPHDRQDVTGGGAWETSGAVGEGSGTFDVTELESWHEAPGTPPPLEDRIGDPGDARAGLVKLGIEYSNGETGILTVSCHLIGTPDSVFEGITASKGFVDFWNREAPQDSPFVDANRTLFHLV